MAEHVNAEMSANVWKILVTPGEAVESEQTLMILESMKMEIPVISEEAGTVSAVHVNEGENVSPGQLLAEIE